MEIHSHICFARLCNYASFFNFALVVLKNEFEIQPNSEILALISELSMFAIANLFSDTSYIYLSQLLFFSLQFLEIHHVRCI